MSCKGKRAVLLMKLTIRQLVPSEYNCNAQVTRADINTEVFRPSYVSAHTSTIAMGNAWEQRTKAQRHGSTACSIVSAKSINDSSKSCNHEAVIKQSLVSNLKRQLHLAIPVGSDSSPMKVLWGNSKMI
jgi:hypothetical protein